MSAHFSFADRLHVARLLQSPSIVPDFLDAIVLAIDPAKMPAAIEKLRSSIKYGPGVRPEANRAREEMAEEFCQSTANAGVQIDAQVRVQHSAPAPQVQAAVVTGPTLEEHVHKMLLQMGVLSRRAPMYAVAPRWSLTLPDPSTFRQMIIATGRQLHNVVDEYRKWLQAATSYTMTSAPPFFPILAGHNGGTIACIMSITFDGLDNDPSRNRLLFLNERRSGRHNRLSMPDPYRAEGDTLGYEVRVGGMRRWARPFLLIENTLLRGHDEVGGSRQVVQGTEYFLIAHEGSLWYLTQDEYSQLASVLMSAPPPSIASQAPPTIGRPAY